jgi:hypothetical protein
MLVGELRVDIDLEFCPFEDATDEPALASEDQLVVLGCCAVAERNDIPCPASAPGSLEVVQLTNATSLGGVLPRNLSHSALNVVYPAGLALTRQGSSGRALARARSTVLLDGAARGHVGRGLIPGARSAAGEPRGTHGARLPRPVRGGGLQWSRRGGFKWLQLASVDWLW